MIYSIDRRPKPPSLPIFNTQLPKFPSFYNLQPISIDSSNSSSILICKFSFSSRHLLSYPLILTFVLICFSFFLDMFATDRSSIINIITPFIQCSSITSFLSLQSMINPDFLSSSIYQLFNISKKKNLD
jgi:hypothetical protein